MALALKSSIADVTQFVTIGGVVEQGGQRIEVSRRIYFEGEAEETPFGWWGTRQVRL